jgi:hypothetical protein
VATAPRSIELRRLVHLDGDGEEARIAEHGYEGQRPPDVGENQPGEGKPRVTQPVEGDTAEGEIDQARRWVKEPLEKLRRHYRRERPRQEQQGHGDPRSTAQAADGHRRQHSADQF